MIKYSYEELLQDKKFSPEEVVDAALIIHPKAKGYNIKAQELACVFEEGSNFTQLLEPLVDAWGNVFRDSEGYYMAARTTDLATKQMIALRSMKFGASRAARRLYTLENDLKKRIDYMREAVTQKFDYNSHLCAKLMATTPRQIIEYTYRNDTFFGIDQVTLTGKNVLGKLLMEYRTNHA